MTCFAVDKEHRGTPNATLVLPVDGSGDRAAERIVKVIRSRHGVSLPVVRADKAAGRVTTPHRIALGCLANNRVIESLYFRWKTLVDRWYPGRGGYVVQMVHSADQPGHHVLILGGSDASGIEAAADCWLTELEQKAGDASDWLLRVELGDPHLPLPEDRIDAVPAQVALVETTEDKAPLPPYESGYTGGSARDHLLRLGMYGPYAYNSHICRSSQLGLRYLYTGREKDGRRYRRAFLEEIDLGVTRKLDHYKSLRMFHMWSALEVSPIFSEADREVIAQAIGEYLLETSGVPSLARLREKARAPELFDRHLACEALNLWAGADYFRRREGGAQWREYQEAVDAYFDHQYGVDVPVTGLVEGYATYLDVYLEWLLMRHPERIAGHPHVRIWADRVVGLCTNAGLLIRGPQTEERRYPYHLLRRLAYLLNDGRYLFVANCRERQVLRGNDLLSQFSAGQAYAGDVEPCEPRDRVGLTVFPMNERRRRWEMPEAPEGKGFDRATGRSGWGLDDEYFAMAGARGSTKPLPIVGTVATYERFGLQLLSSPLNPLLARENNASSYMGVTVTIDGLGAPLLNAALVTAAESLAEAEILSITATAPGQYEWQRTAAWKPEGFLLVVDRVRVLAGSAFTVAVNWRPCQPMTVSGQRATARGTSPEGRGCTFHIEVSAKSDLIYDEVPHCDLVDDLRDYIRLPRLRAVVHSTAAESPVVEIATLLHAIAGDGGPVFRLAQAQGRWVVGGPKCDLHFHHLDGSGGTSVSHVAPSPRLCSAPADGGWATHAAEPADAAALAWTLPVEGRPSAWAVDRDKERLAIGMADGKLMTADSSGTPLWETQQASAVTAITFLGRDVIAGFRSGALMRFDEQGQSVWKHECRFRTESTYWPWWCLKTPRIAAIAAASDPETGRDYVMVGTGSSALNMLDADTGQLLTDLLYAHGLPDIIRPYVMEETGDLRFLVAASALSASSAVGSWPVPEGGSELYRYARNPSSPEDWDMSGVVGFFAGRLLSGAPERLAVLCYGTYNQLRCHDLAGGDVLWTVNLGGGPLALEAVASRGLGRKDIFCLDRYGWLSRFDPHGNLVWSRRMGLPVEASAQAGATFSGMAACLPRRHGAGTADSDRGLVLWDRLSACNAQAGSACLRVEIENEDGRRPGAASDPEGLRIRLAGQAIAWLELSPAAGMLTFDGSQVLLERLP